MSIVFKTLPVAKHVDRFDTLSPTVLAFEPDTVTLGWEDRLKARARRRSDRGIEFATALARGTVLFEGDCFVFEAQRIVIRVVELEEPMLVVRPVSSDDWGLFGYHIGNSHQPMMIADGAMICPDALGMDQILTYHRIPFERERRRFTPIGQLTDHQHHVAR